MRVNPQGGFARLVGSLAGQRSEPATPIRFVKAAAISGTAISYRFFSLLQPARVSYYLHDEGVGAAVECSVHFSRS